MCSVLCGLEGQGGAFGKDGTVVSRLSKTRGEAPHLRYTVRGGLVFAEGAGAAGAAHAAAGRAGGARQGRASVMGAGAFRDGASASADEAADRPAAGGTNLERGVGHFLALLEAGGAGVAEVFVGGHVFSLIHFTGNEL